MLCHVIVLMYPFSYSMDSCWWTAKTPLFFLASRCQSCLFAVLCVESTGFFLSCKDREIDTTGCLLPIFLILIVHITVGCSSVATNSLTCPLISIVASAAVPVSIFFQRLNELFLNQNGCYSARQGVTFDLIGRVFTLSSPYCCSPSLSSAWIFPGVFGVTTPFPDSLCLYIAFTYMSHFFLLRNLFFSTWTNDSGYIFDNACGGQQGLASRCHVRYPKIRLLIHSRQGMSSQLLFFF